MSATFKLAPMFLAATLVVYLLSLCVVHYLDAKLDECILAFASKEASLLRLP